MSLRNCQSECIELFYEMRKRAPKGRLAAPFLSVRESNWAVGEVRPILFVGKATDGDWKEDKFRACARDRRVEERLRASRDFVGAMRSRPKSAFWRFWNSLGHRGLPVIWTNLAKIGVTSGNPRGWYLEAQCDLAVKTLEAEVKEYNPILVVLVTSDYAKDQIVYRKWPQKNWTVSDYDLSTCWINASDGEPAVLWTDHPQGKRAEKVSYWLGKACSLLGN